MLLVAFDVRSVLMPLVDPTRLARVLKDILNQSTNQSFYQSFNECRNVVDILGVTNNVAEYGRLCMVAWLPQRNESLTYNLCNTPIYRQITSNIQPT